MKLKQLPGFCLLVLFALASCKKSSNPAPEPKLDTGLYITGFQDNLGLTLWKNGVASVLSGPKYGAARAIAVSGNDMYIAGIVTFGPDSSAIGTAIYWKNNVITKLTNGTTDAEAYDIAVSGKDVYVCGYVSASTTSQILASQVATYWKNGVLTRLTNTVISPSAAYQIVVSGTDVYVLGNINGVPVYWKNGVVNHVGDPSKIVSIGAIAVQNSNLYLTYSEDEADSSVVSYLWKNGVTTQLLNDQKVSLTSCLLINGSDVYIGGFVAPASFNTETAAVWKNNVLQKLPQLPGNRIPVSGVIGIVVSGNDIYAAGQSQGTVLYWKNGVAVQVGNHFSIANGIAIVH